MHVLFITQWKSISPGVHKINGLILKNIINQEFRKFLRIVQVQILIKCIIEFTFNSKSHRIKDMLVFIIEFLFIIYSLWIWEQNTQNVFHVPVTCLENVFYVVNLSYTSIPCIRT